MLEKFSVGIDIIEVKRFASITFSSHPTFYKKMFLPSEIKYCLKYKNPAPHFAGKFAVKEAAKKIIQGHITMLDIETFHLKSKPMLRLKGTWDNKYLFKVSISHEKNYAIAIVISEKLGSFANHI